MGGKLQVIVGGQFGSEGKGALAAWLARKEYKPLLAVRVAGPNAGHTAYDDNGVEFKLQQVPVAAAVTPNSPGQIALAIAAGSEIDEQILHNEIEYLQQKGHNVSGRIFIDSQATILEEKYMVQEHGGMTTPDYDPSATVIPHGEGGLTKRIGSTGKGVGAARAARIMREAKTWSHFDEGSDVAEMIRLHLIRGGTVQIEGTQGFGLGLHAGYYPYCTSSDCRAIDFMAMAGVSPWSYFVEKLEVWIAFRTYPIRVAGDSGPLFRETTWEAIGQRPEFTTVTKKIRRVGVFDVNLARRAIKANGGGGGVIRVALMFADYVAPEIFGLTGTGLHGGEVSRRAPWLMEFEDDIGESIDVVGTGPQTIAEVRNR